MIGTSEAMNLGVKLGMDAPKLAEVLNSSTGKSWSSESNNPVPGVGSGVPAGRGYTGGFGSALMRKDLSLAWDAASSVGAALPLGGKAFHLYTELCHEYPNKDFSVIYKYLSDMKTPQVELTKDTEDI
eukprot:CAMPEP_0119042628 /NCGR_PEP_ID=MMETSP1177-20130426/16037_1 /TAXON_ID=2985 /ORGANISM="Ochromonas sp, Strain CCMP1899" /LENGTH=127 /DNA_ID=CAMNT_0007009557 /DNA_START=285 /DNA_END=668 /DNA_ORIENTATION=+